MSRNWNRRNFCIFCRKLVSNFRRHQLRNHPLEKEVIDFLAISDPDLKKRKWKRQAVFDELRRRGNYVYNSSVDSKSKILPIRRPDTLNKEIAYQKFVHCAHCLRAFSKKTFYRHKSKCPKKIRQRDKDVEENADESLSLFNTSHPSKVNLEAHIPDKRESFKTLLPSEIFEDCVSPTLSSNLEIPIAEHSGTPKENLNLLIGRDLSSKNGVKLPFEEKVEARKSFNFGSQNEKEGETSIGECKSHNKIKTVKIKKTSRNWNRRNFCIFCRKLVSNFRRHQLRNHPLEKEVIDFLAISDPDLKKRKWKRQAVFDELRRRGNYVYNSSIDSKSKILPIRRPDTLNKEIAYQKFVHCVHCLGAFSRKTFYRHESNCPKKTRQRDKDVEENADESLSLFNTSQPSNIKHSKNHVLKNFSTIICPSSEDDAVLVKKIFPIMKKDEISRVAMDDSLIKSIASQFLRSHMDKKDEYSVTKKMRGASKLLLYCRKDPTIKHFVDCFKPKNVGLVMEAVENLSGYDKLTGTVKVIGMPARLAYVIQEGAKVTSDSAILSDSMSRATKEAIKTDTSEFLQLFKNKWKYYISKNAEKTRKKQSSVTPIIMPDDGDIKTMSDSVKNMEIDNYNKLSQDVTADNYEHLCKCTIAHIILLSRRRPGEVVRSELSQYINRPQNECLTPDVLSALTKDERMALPEVSVFMVPRKPLPAVPILLTKSMEKSIDLIITCRSTLKIPPENPLLFARVYTLNPFDGSKILRELRSMCKLMKPDLLTATGLRHHITTKSKEFGNPEFTEKICQHLGHTSKKHKNNYRFPIQAMQRGQVSQLLKLNGTWEKIVKKKTDYSERENNDKDKTPEPDPSNDPSYVNDSCDSDDSCESEVEEKCRCRPPITRVRWSDCEKEVVVRSFANFIVQKKTPGRVRCEQTINKYAVLKNRTWKQVNALVHNIFTYKVKLQSKFRCLLPENCSF